MILRRLLIVLTVLVVSLLVLVIVKGEYRAHVLSTEKQKIKLILDSDPKKFGQVRVIGIKRFANGLEGTVVSSEDLKLLYGRLDAAGVNNTVRNVHIRTP